MSNEISRRRLLQCSAWTIAGTALAACTRPPATAPSSDKTEGSAAPAAVQPQRVTFTMYGHPNMVEEMVPLFNDTHPEVNLVFERSEGQGYWEKLTAAVAAGTAWDCFRVNPTYAMQWGPRGVTADLMPFLEADTTYPASVYLPGVVEVYHSEGRLVGLPAWVTTHWVFYNKRMFDEAGLGYPNPQTTWDEYVEMAKAVTKSDARGQITQYGTMGWDSGQGQVAQVVWSNGGCFFYNEDLTRVCMDDPKTIEALQDIADLVHVHKTNPNPAVPAAVPVGILSDNVATQMAGDWLPWDNNEVWMEKYDYLDATIAPTRNGNRVNPYWPTPFVINSRSAVKEGAYKWASWFAADPASTAIQCRVVSPVTIAAYEGQSIMDTWLTAPRPPSMIAQALEHTKQARFWKVQEHIGDISSIYGSEISRLWTGQATAEEVARTITELANEAMQKPVQ